MPAPDTLTAFVQDALGRQHSPDQIRHSLRSADWADSEIDAALAAWQTGDGGIPVPRPVRSTAARDAFFYALLFVAFGMVAANTLTLIFGLLNFWLPDVADRFTSYSVSGLRWSMAALIVFVPAFLLLDRTDSRAGRTDPARQHGTVRRWLSSLALFVAVITLMGDAIYLLYTWLDGQITLRFIAKSLAVAVVACLVLAYFLRDRAGMTRLHPAGSPLLASTLAALVVVLSFSTIGGPRQGMMEQRDSARLADLRTLAHDIERCPSLNLSALPETLDPITCAANPLHLTGLAPEVSYRRLAANRFQLCVPLEAPARVDQYVYDTRISDNTACLERETG